MKRALCIGHLSYDITLPLEGYPIENTKYQIDRILESSGGPAANAASLLSQWGIETTFLGTVGGDSYGERALKDLENSGVHTRNVLRKEEYTTPLSIILVNTQTGSRTIVNRRGHGRIRASEAVALFRSLQTAPPDLLLFDGHEPEASLASLESFPQAISILDAGSLRTGTELLAPLVDYCIASERFAREVAATDSRTDIPPTDKPLDESLDSFPYGYLLIALNARGIRHPVITLGEKGCCFLESAEPLYDSDSLLNTASCLNQATQVTPPIAHAGFSLSAYPAKAVDTTGAGDIFHGAFAAALLWGKSLREALLLATVASGLSVERLGGRTSIPPYEEVMKAREHWMPAWHSIHTQ